MDKKDIITEILKIYMKINLKIVNNKMDQTQPLQGKNHHQIST
jgi:hypothetical protein